MRRSNRDDFPSLIFILQNFILLRGVYRTQSNIYAEAFLQK